MFLLWNTIYFFIIGFVLFCSGDNDVKTEKNPVVEKIIEKIFNITSQAFQNASPEAQETMMKKIESKLIKSAEHVGPKADKYIKLVMEGLRIMANSQTKNENTDGILGVNKRSNLRTTNDTEEVVEPTTKDKAKELANKILKLAGNYFEKTEKSSNDKLKILKNIKEKVLETAKKKHDLIHVKHDEIKKYSDLITQGMELIMKNMTQESNKRRMVMEFVNSGPQSDRDEYYDSINFFSKDHKNKQDSIDKEYADDSIVSTTDWKSYNVGLTTPLSCDEVFHRTCADIKSLNEFVCKSNGETLPLSNLCDGEPDCADGSDEGNCVNQAMKRLQSATSLTSRIENFLLRNCFLSDDNSLLIKQNTVLYEVLQKEKGFINKYKNMKRNALELTNALVFKRTLNEVIIVINTLASALDSSLCIRYMNEKKAQEDARKFNPFDTDDLDELTEKPVPRIALRSCVCSGSFCANLTCPDACRTVCWHKHNLGRWMCQAIDDGTSVPLDVVCDGKLDCYDETDENDCRIGVSNAKFEANDVFDRILTLMSQKSSMVEYAAVKNKLIALGNSILQLQKIVMKPKADVHDVKNIRDACYASITSIYEDVVSKTSDVKQLEDTHLFLLTLNEKLMTALKLSHTGNIRLITPDGCYCRRDRCAMTKCSMKCKRTCAASVKLSRYWCKGTVNNNISIPLAGICDGSPNCPFEDDESRCSYDVCRKHHLMLMRYNIRDVGEKHKGTALGEALLTWKEQVISSVKIAENNYKPLPTAFRDLVADLLRDLVTVYAGMDDTRRTNRAYLLKEFYDISQRMIEGLKACGK